MDDNSAHRAEHVSAPKAWFQEPKYVVARPITRLIRAIRQGKSESCRSPAPSASTTELGAAVKPRMRVSPLSCPKPQVRGGRARRPPNGQGEDG